MANTNAPNGFQYFGRMDGGSPTVGNTTRKIVSTYGTAIGYGDPVISVASGYIQRATASTVQIAGIFYGCSYLNSAVGRVVWSPNWPGTTQGSDAVAYLNTDPQSLFIAQSNDTAIAFADIDANIQFVIGTPATTAAGGFSTTALDQSTIATTDTLPFRIVGLYSDYVPSGGANGTEASAYNRVIVAPNYWDRRSLVGIV